MAPSTKGSPGYCKEGFEETVGTNHLGHFLLANLLIKVRKSSQKVHFLLLHRLSRVISFPRGKSLHFFYQNIFH